jgi:raffinose synthase
MVRVVQARQCDDGGEQQAQTPGLKLLVEDAKREHGVRYVYVWHAMAGYRGGVKLAAEGMEHYESALGWGWLQQRRQGQN